LTQIIKVLLVDDDNGFLNTIQKKFKLNDYGENIDICLFGQDQGDIIDEDVGRSFISYLHENKDKFIADVIFCDYDLAKGVTATRVLKIAKNIISIPPIVVMTANKNSLQQEAVDSINAGARGYIIKTFDGASSGSGNDYFIQEMTISAMSVNQEHKRNTIQTIITEISKNTNMNSIKSLADSFIESFQRNYPYFTVFIRMVNNQKLKLMASTIKDTKFINAIECLDRSEVEVLFNLIESDKGVIINNNFDNIDLNLGEEYKIFLDKLNFKKAIFIRIGSKAQPLGTISIYSSDVNRNFNEKQSQDFQLATQTIVRDWRLLDEKRKHKDIIEFIDAIAEEENEDKIWDKLCNLVHEHFNQNSNQNQTTIKISKVGSSILDRIYCKGTSCSCNGDDLTNIYDETISSWVYRNNHHFQIQKDDLMINSKLKTLKQSIKDNLNKKFGDGNIEFKMTNEKIISELCLPISSNGEVYAVINLESNLNNIYDKEVRESIERLIKISAKRINNIRQNRFMKQLIQAISRETYKQRFEESVEFLQDFIGYRFFSVVIKEKNRLILEEFNFPKEKNSDKQNLFAIDVENLLNEEKSATKKFLEGKEDFLYIYDGTYLEDFVKAIDNNKIQSKSQFLARLKSGNDTIGVISFNFSRTNPLNKHKQELLKGFIRWFNREINENRIYEKINKRVAYFEKKGSMDWFFRNLSHMIGGENSKAKADLTMMKLSYKRKDEEKFLIKLEKVQRYLGSIANFPKRFISSAEYDFSTIAGAYESVISDLEMRQIGKTIETSLEDIDIQSSHTSMLYLLLFHPILNALEENSVTVINISAKVDNNIAIIEIRDNGKGFPNLNLVFEKNATTKSSGGGFGLAFIKPLIENELQGEIEAYNDNGAVIIIKIPTVYRGGKYEI